MRLTKKQRERLEILSAFLRDFVPAEGQKFDMRIWGQHEIAERPTARMCGTAACAAGWATSIPALKADGLQLRWRLRDDQYYAWIGLRGDQRRLSSAYESSAARSFAALKKFFGTKAPFDPDTYRMQSTEIMPQHVALYIDGILAGAE